MTLVEAAPRSHPVNPAALGQRIAHLLPAKAAATNPLVVIAAAPVWPPDPLLTTREGIRVRVVPCVSVLAIWEQAVAERDLPCVVLTEVPEQALGAGLRSRIFRRQIFGMDPWALIADAFGAQRLDSRLERLRWAGAALMAATPSGGWPRLAGTVLSRDTALRHLLAERFALGRIGVTPDDIDASALLRWSRLPCVDENVTALTGAERDGLLGWLIEEFGPTAQVLAALVASEHVADALPLGLVCDALWKSDDPAALRAQGKVDLYMGGTDLDATVLRGFADVATATMADLLHGDDRRHLATADRHTARSVLTRAEELLTMFSARDSARHSGTLQSGFDHRLDTVARALTAAATGDRTVLLQQATAAVADLNAHALAGIHRHRVERAEMAVRLLRWLATATPAPTDLIDGIDRHVTDWSWADLALGHVWAGEDAHAALARAYGTVHDRVRARRADLDHGFAAALRQWADQKFPAAGLLTIETVLQRVVAPIVQAGDRGVLLIVLDGMSASVAADLTDDLTEHGWLEHDPLAEKAGSSVGRRRGAVAGLPTITAVSRTSLLTGSLRRGGQSDERSAFEQHRLWRGRPARLFHQNTVYGAAGDVLNEELVAALSETNTVVGVVLNTVDDALDKGRESADAGWRIDQLGPLRTLLDHARYHGRAVIITSDHGHVLERDGALRPAGAPQSARHRTDAAPAGDGEVELAGERVLDGEHRVVALWDAQQRYLPRRAGYHGGAAAAEVTVPVIALLPLGAVAPSAWRALGPQQPPWWSAGPAPTPQPAPADEAAPARRGGSGKSRKNTPPEPTTALFDLPAAPDAPVAVARPALVEQVLASEMFLAQHALTPRRVPVDRIRRALTALVDANGILPCVVVAQQAGEQPARATGFLTTLQRIFNVDNFAVLSVIDDGRTARLDLALLRQQFGVDGGPR